MQTCSTLIIILHRKAHDIPIQRRKEERWHGQLWWPPKHLKKWQGIWGINVSFSHWKWLEWSTPAMVPHSPPPFPFLFTFRRFKFAGRLVHFLFFNDFFSSWLRPDSVTSKGLPRKRDKCICSCARSVADSRWNAQFLFHSRGCRHHPSCKTSFVRFTSWRSWRSSFLYFVLGEEVWQCNALHLFVWPTGSSVVFALTGISFFVSRSPSSRFSVWLSMGCA